MRIAHERQIHLRILLARSCKGLRKQSRVIAVSMPATDKGKGSQRQSPTMAVVSDVSYACAHDVHDAHRQSMAGFE